MDRFVLWAVSTLTKPPIRMQSYGYVQFSILCLRRQSKERCVLCNCMAPEKQPNSPRTWVLFYASSIALKSSFWHQKKKNKKTQKKPWMDWGLPQRWRGRKETFIRKVLRKYNKRNRPCTCFKRFPVSVITGNETSFKKNVFTVFKHYFILRKL